MAKNKKNEVSKEAKQFIAEMVAPTVAPTVAAVAKLADVVPQYVKRAQMAYGGQWDLAKIAHHGVDASTLPKGVFNIDLSEAFPVQALNPRQASFGNPLADISAKWEENDKDGDGKGKWVGCDSAKLADGCTRFLRGGWDHREKPAGVLEIGNNGELRSLMLAHLDAWLAMLEESHPEIATTAKLVYANRDKITKVIVQRQRFTHAAVAAIHWRNSQPGAKPSFDFPISASYVESANFRQLLLDAVKENLNVGQKTMTSVDFLVLAKQLRDLDPASFSQNLLLRNNIKKGEAQRIDNILKLDADYPQLRIVERMSMTPPADKDAVKYDDNCYLPISSFSHVAVTRVNKGEKPDGKGEKIENFGPKWVAKWLRDTAQNGRVTGVSITNIVEQFGTSQCLLLRELVAAIVANDLAAFKKNLLDNLPRLDVINAVWTGKVETPEEYDAVNEYVNDNVVIDSTETTGE